MEQPNAIGAQWSQIHQFDQKMILTIYSLYQDPFFIEVRNFLSNLLEDRFLDCNLDPENSSHHPFILKLIGELNAEIKARAHQLELQDPTSYIRVRLLQASTMISTGYPMLPISLYRHICYCLGAERELIRQARMGQSQTLPRQDDELTEMNTKCNELKMKSFTISQLLKYIQTCQEQCNIQVNSRKNLDSILAEHLALRQTGNVAPSLLNGIDFEKSLGCQKDQLEQEILGQISKINEKRKMLRDKQDELLLFISETLKKVISLLSNWKKEQQTTGQHTIAIEEIQKWCEILAGVIIDTGNQLNEVISLEKNYTIPFFASKSIIEVVLRGDYEHKLDQLLKDLIYNAFIVESQPQQIIKKSTKFSVTIRFLIGLKLNLPSGGMLNVDASILNEAGVRAIRKNGPGKVKPIGDLLNNKQKFQLDGGTSRYYAEFRNIQVKKVTHNDKKPSGNSVLDESFWLLFQTQITYNKITYKVLALSVPIKVISHVSQEAQAWETLIWNAALGQDGNSDQIPFPQIAQALNNKFTMMTKKSLTEEHLIVIKEKAFSVPGGSGNSNCLSWIQFCKNRLPGKDFTFWIWFYEIAKLTAEHLCGNKFCKSGPWQDGLIVGFIQRNQAEEFLLHNGRCGTFLLRFSDSELGGISISWVHMNKTVMSVTPFNSKDLTARSLSERILDISYLLYLHPDKSKQQAFQPYVPPPAKESANSESTGALRLTKTKYVRALLQMSLVIGDDHSTQVSSPIEIPECPDYTPSLNPTPEVPITPDWNALDSIFNSFPESTGDCVATETEEQEIMDFTQFNDGVVKEFTDYILDLYARADSNPDTPGDGYTTSEDGYHSGDGSPQSCSSNDMEYFHL